MVPGVVNTSATDDAYPTPLDKLDGHSYELVAAPPYIPANLGVASKFKEGLVLHLLNLFNARGRTLVRVIVSYTIQGDG